MTEPHITENTKCEATKRAIQKTEWQMKAVTDILIQEKTLKHYTKEYSRQGQGSHSPLWQIASFQEGKSSDASTSIFAAEKSSDASSSIRGQRKIRVTGAAVLRLACSIYFWIWGNH